jgi:acetyl-CoA carboxylase biotin carboxyl carrier protein
VSARDDRATEDGATSEIGEQERLAGLVHAFISMMHAGNIARMDLEYRDLRLSLRAHGESASPATVVASIPVTAQQMTVPATAAIVEADTDHHIVTAPMIGTFYVAPAPNEPPFVQVGDRVQEGQTIGIIEAMKIMNEIAADRSGVVVEVLARNAQTVEYGSPLVKLALDACAS